jgi:hypothetical protein
MHTYTITGAALKDEEGNDFLVVSLPTEYIQTEAERLAWQNHLGRQFQFQVVIAFWKTNEDWILRGDGRLLRLLEARDIDALPWQRVLVESSEPPPISYDPPPPEPNETQS